MGPIHGWQSHRLFAFLGGHTSCDFVSARIAALDRCRIPGALRPRKRHGIHGAAFWAWVCRPASDVEQVQADIEEFWWEALVVSKELLRGEPLAAGYCAESVMRHGLLRRMLEWMAGVVTGWSQPGGPYGRGVTQVLPVDLVERAQSRILSWEGEAGWAELDRMATLFAEVARSVCANIGAAYPDEIEHGARAMITERRSAVG